LIDTFKALSEESRLRILALLIDGDLCVCEIEAKLSMTQSNVSRHLSALKNSGIVESKKKAQWAYYGISEQFKLDEQYLWLFLKEKFSQAPYLQWKNVRDEIICKETSLDCLNG
jgi:ArsR family transcriptional regulator